MWFIIPTFYYLLVTYLVAFGFQNLLEEGSGRLACAKDYLTTLVRMNVDEKEDAKGLLRRLQSYDQALNSDLGIGSK